MLKRFWLKATAVVLGACLAVGTAAAYPPPKPAKPMPSKPKPVKPMPVKPKPVKPKPGKPGVPKHGKFKHKHLPSHMHGKALYHKHKFSHRHQKFHHHFRCRMYWHLDDQCWYYWHPRFACYLPVTFIYVYPPEEMEEEEFVPVELDE
jgi:hypothetical protein